MGDIKKYLKSSHLDLDVEEVLRSPIDVLLGVTSGASTALKALEINTVFDLALSQRFAAAALLSEVRPGLQDPISRLNLVPADLVDASAASIDASELKTAGVEVIAGIGSSNAAAIKRALNAKTVRELALWPPYQAAKDILAAAIVPPKSDLTSDDPPADLLPRSGEYPTERVFYNVLILDQLVGSATSSAQPLTGQVDIATLDPSGEGFKQPATGAYVTYAQSWYNQGVGLGQLLHSVALAPGESTRIAMIDWTRRLSASQIEDTTETDQLSNTLDHSRSISEVTNAVARESQAVFARTQSTSSTEQYGSSTGAFFGLGVAADSYGSATTAASGTSFAVASGVKDLSANMTQNINDTTHQAANSARNRRASVVREVSQSESEKVTTRAITNYNHMHALSIQYYEMVQVYRVTVALQKARRTLMIPMKLVDFRSADVINRYRSALWAAALRPDIKDALNYPTGTTRIQSPIITTSDLFEPTTPGSSPLDDLSPDRWNAADIKKAIVDSQGVIRVLDDGRLVLPSDALLYDIDFVSKDSAIQPVNLTIRKLDGTSISVTYATAGGWILPANRPRIDDVASITMTASGVTGTDKIGFVSVIFSFKKTGGFRIVFPVKMEQVGPLPIAYVATVAPDVMTHLQDSRLYYNQAIWRSLDPGTMGMLLSSFSFDGTPLTELVEPSPVTICGNYLVFLMNVTDKTAPAWEKWLKDHGVTADKVQEDIIPLPSGGVFAEAVLGRANSAEKLDITRFWNWQDSPIPITAPEIAPVQTGKTGQDPNLTTGQLGPSLLNIVNPPSLPDPTGLSATINGLMSNSVIRDIGALATTASLAQQAMQTSGAGATNAATTASNNLSTVADLYKALTLAAISAATGVPLGGGGSGARQPVAPTASNAGAMINQGKSLDQRAGGSIGTNGAAAAGATGSSLGATAGTSSPGPVGSAGNASGSNEQKAFDSMLGGSASGGTAGGVLGQFQKMVMGALPPPVTAAVGLTDPGRRRCCALMAPSGAGGGALDPTKLAGHGIGGLFPAGPTGYVYTKKAGFVDLGHLRDMADMTKFVFENLIKGATVLELYEGNATVNSLPTDAASILLLAGAIAYVESWAHELVTWPDYSSFSPEDLCSNIIGIECGQRAIRKGGSYNATMDFVIDQMINSELIGVPESDTTAALAAKSGDWFDATSLLRRNFDGTPWMAGMPFDPPASISIPWLSPSSVEPYFSEFKYTISSPVGGTAGVTLATMKTVTNSIRSAFVLANPGKDRP